MTEKKPLIKKSIPGMYPVKKWLTPDEACSYLNISNRQLVDLVAKKGLTVSQLAVNGAKGRKYYKVSELDNLLEENVFIRKVQ